MWSAFLMLLAASRPTMCMHRSTTACSILTFPTAIPPAPMRTLSRSAESSEKTAAKRGSRAQGAGTRAKRGQARSSQQPTMAMREWPLFPLVSPRVLVAAGGCCDRAALRASKPQEHTCFSLFVPLSSGGALRDGLLWGHRHTHAPTATTATALC